MENHQNLRINDSEEVPVIDPTQMEVLPQDEAGQVVAMSPQTSEGCREAQLEMPKAELEFFLGLPMRRLPVEVQVLYGRGDRSVHEVPETLTGCFLRIQEGLSQYCEQNSLTLTDESPFLRRQGVLSRIWNGTPLARWWSEKFPFQEFNISRSDSGEVLCRVQVSRSVLSGGVRAKVLPCKGAEQIAFDVERVLSESSSPYARISDTGAHVPEQRLSAQRTGEPQISMENFHREVERATGQDMKRALQGIALGLGPSATDRDIRSIEELLNSVVKALRDLADGKDSGFERKITNGKVQFSTVIQIPTPDHMKRLMDKSKFMEALADNPLVYLGIFFTGIPVLIESDVYGTRNPLVGIGGMLAPCTLPYLNLAFSYWKRDRGCQKYLAGALASREAVERLKSFDLTGLNISLKWLGSNADKGHYEHVQLSISNRVPSETNR
jgi:hypothetical protein